MKLGLPKNTWIDDASLDFAREGFHSGVLMVALHFSGGSCPGDDFVADLLSRLAKAPIPKTRRIVRFTGLYDPKDQSLLVLLYALKSYGFSVQVVFQAGFVASWLEKADWLILRTEKPVVLFATNEVWYYPPEGSPLVDLTLPPKHGLLYLTKGRSANETIKFIAESEHVWNLL